MSVRSISWSRQSRRLQEVNSSGSEERTETNSASGRGSSSVGSSLWKAGSSCVSRAVTTSRGSGTAVSWNAGSLAVGIGSSGIAGVQDLVDDVGNTVGNEHVGDDNLCVVDEDTIAADGDGDALAVDGLERSAVGKLGRVPNCTGDDVVGQDAAKLSNADIGCQGGNALESLVGGSENGQVGGVVDGVNEVGLLDSGE